MHNQATKAADRAVAKRARDEEENRNGWEK